MTLQLTNQQDALARVIDLAQNQLNGLKFGIGGEKARAEVQAQIEVCKALLTETIQAQLTPDGVTNMAIAILQEHGFSVALTKKEKTSGGSA